MIMMKIKKLVFEESKFDSIICLNAKLPGKSFFGRFPECEIIAADGAALKLMDIGVNCDYIIGDMDSFYKDPRSEHFEKKKIINLPDQNSNDFEKILNWCIENDRKNLLITGMHGGELEHTLNNQSVLLRYARRLNMCVYDAGRYGLPIFESIEFDCRNGEIISIIPFMTAVLTTRNLKWELNNSTLKYGENEGARNQSEAGNVEIILHEGFFMLFLDSKAPKCPFFL